MAYLGASMGVLCLGHAMRQMRAQRASVDDVPRHDDDMSKGPGRGGIDGRDDFTLNHTGAKKKHQDHFCYMI
jgi:hypothetical protein